MKSFCIKMEDSLMHALHIPKKFADTMKESVSENIELEVPGGTSTWHVSMVRSNDTYALQTGWKDFVTANKINKNDTLVFTYKDNSLFEVFIFDPSGCEKIATFFAKEMAMHQSEESNDSSVRGCAVPRHEVKKETISLSSGTDTESASKVSCKRKRRDILPESTDTDQEENRPVRTREKKSPQKKFRFLVVPNKTNLTKSQAEIADRMARKARKGSDLFVRILTSLNTDTQRYCVLNLPSGFACSALRNKKQTITLLPADLDKSKGCIAKYSYNNRNVRCIRWRKFVRKNSLKEGDLCLFELRKQEIQGKSGLTMLVHFETESEDFSDSSVRVGAALNHEIKKEHISVSSGSDTESSSDTPSCAVRAHKRTHRGSTDSDKGRNRIIRKRKAYQGKKTSMPYIVPYNIILTKAQEKVANRMAENTRKGTKLFVKFLTKFNAREKGALNLPRGFTCETLRNKKRKIALIPANVDKRNKRCTGYYSENKSMRCIGSGWPEFVRRNRLREGDFCLFELREEQKHGKLVLTMVVHFDH